MPIYFPVNSRIVELVQILSILEVINELFVITNNWSTVCDVGVENRLLF